jgi:hypothetical protein
MRFRISTRWRQCYLAGLLVLLEASSAFHGHKLAKLVELTLSSPNPFAAFAPIDGAFDLRSGVPVSRKHFSEVPSDIASALAAISSISVTVSG